MKSMNSEQATIDFFSSIKIEESEKDKASHYIFYRGLLDHIRARDYLLTFEKDVSYDEIATLFRYEKRIRRILFKFIGFVEEYLRATITNYYTGDLSREALKSIANYPRKPRSVYELQFSELIKAFHSLPKELQETTFKFNAHNTEGNLKALNKLRDIVCHNDFLFSLCGYKKVETEEGTNASLVNNMRNLSNYLPPFIRENFSNEINGACTSGSKKHDSQVAWDLLEAAEIKLQ